LDRKFRVDTFSYKTVFHQRSYATINLVLPKDDTILHNIETHVLNFSVKLDDIIHGHLDFFLISIHFFHFFQNREGDPHGGCMGRILARSYQWRTTLFEVAMAHLYVVRHWQP
jgi:hypothetical protein